MSSGIELPQASNASQISQASNREQIQQNVDPELPLVPNPPPQSNNFRPLLKKLLKILVIVFLLGLSIWVISYLLSEEYLKSRVPESLTAQNFLVKKQLIAPGESDYVSFTYYKLMQDLARKVNSQNREVMEEDLKPFKSIKFKELYDIFKVARTIQLAKQFSESQEVEKFNYQPTEGIDIDEPRNYTQYFGKIANQFQCASCYSFPIAATIQFIYKFKYNITVKLSQQQLIDCVNDDPQINGCDDGNITKGFEYAMNVGLVSENDYPYQSIQGKSFKCKKQLIGDEKVKKYKISDFKILPKGNCQAIKEQLVKNNTVASMINALGLSSFIPNETFSDCERVNLNHAITIVGQTEKNQWIVRNSWGENWGEQGYFKMGRGNTCGVCSHSIVPKLVIENGKVLSRQQLNNNDHQSQ